MNKMDNDLDNSYECPLCGNNYDGCAQCMCWLDNTVNIEGDSKEMPIVIDDDDDESVLNKHNNIEEMLLTNGWLKKKRKLKDTETFDIYKRKRKKLKSSLDSIEELMYLK